MLIHSEYRSVQPQPIANGFPILVNENAIVWKGEE